MKIAAFVLLGLLILTLLGGGCVFQGYNHAIGLDEEVKQRWAQVENQLQRRYDLIPNLVNTVKGFAGQEQKVFLGVAEARKSYFQAQESGTVAEKARAAGDVERTLSRLLMLQETYPELKSNESFLKLQDELEGTENRLSVERKRYNDSVQVLNTYVRRFPGTFFAGLAGVSSAEYFKVEAAAKETPKVDFSEPAEKT
ncbi:MAG TPA: LemA family protein [Pirellulales bacterium]|nr:LemA family protein [Pirellulales bacterium]